MLGDKQDSKAKRIEEVVTSGDRSQDIEVLLEVLRHVTIFFFAE